MTRTLLHNERYDVLNTLALKKMATAETIADASGLSADQVRNTLQSLAADGLAVTVGDQALPTDVALPALVASAAQRYRDLREDPAVLDMAGKFEVVNGKFLVAISSWQQVEVGGRKIANDHEDSEYDSKVLARMDKLVSRLQQLIEVLTVRDPRFEYYVRRFSRATERIDEGHVDYVSSPTLDSVHNVWFEFHEDLLRTLGRARTE